MSAVSAQAGEIRPTSSKSVSALAGLLLLLLSVAIAYSPVFKAGFLENWDDGEYVKYNGLLMNADGLRKIWLEPLATPQYYPLVHTTYWLEYRAWGIKPAGYHAVNVALHATNAVLLWSVLAALGLPGAWLAAAIFALHPVHVESVAWITERKNVLSGFFYLASLRCLVSFLGLRAPASTPDGQPGSSPPRWGLYAAALALFISALLSKTVTVTLPVAVLLLVWWKRKRYVPGSVVSMIPFFAVGATMALATAILERAHVGAQGPEWDFSPVDRVLIAGRAFWFYLSKIFAPLDLTFTYPRWRIDAGQWRQYLFPAALVLLAVVLWFRSRRGERGGLAGLLLFIVTLAPALGFVNFYPMRYSFVADHFQYLASVIPISLAAAFYATRVAPGAAALFSPAFAFPQGPFRTTVVLAVPTLALVTLGMLTWRQSSLYRSEETLMRQNIEKNPESWVNHGVLALIFFRQGRIDEALQHSETAVRILPSDPSNLNLHGVLLKQKGRYAEAMWHFYQALRYDPDNAQAQSNILLTQRLMGGQPRNPQGGR